MDDFRFNIRVYGVLMNQKNQILVTDEYRNKLLFTKFPGGGLEFGEGIIDCLKREFMEELNSPVMVGDHFYTTDYFQPSAFNDKHQLISIYYLVNSQELEQKVFADEKFKFDIFEDGAQSFRWVDFNRLDPDEFMFPVDKLVVNKLIEKFSSTNNLL